MLQSQSPRLHSRPTFEGRVHALHAKHRHLLETVHEYGIDQCVFDVSTVTPESGYELKFRRRPPKKEVSQASGTEHSRALFFFKVCPGSAGLRHYAPHVPAHFIARLLAGRPGTHLKNLEILRIRVGAGH